MSAKLVDRRRAERRRRKLIRLAKAFGILAAISGFVALWAGVVLVLFNLFGVRGVFGLFLAVFAAGLVWLFYEELE